MSDYKESSSSEEEEIPTCKQEFTITFRVIRSEYYEGSGGTEAYCQGCRDKPKRFWILHLAGGGLGILCRDCASRASVGLGIASDCGNAWTPKDERYKNVLIPPLLFESLRFYKFLFDKIRGS